MDRQQETAAANAAEDSELRGQQVFSEPADTNPPQDELGEGVELSQVCHSALNPADQVAIARGNLEMLVGGFVSYSVPTYWQRREQVELLLRSNIVVDWPRTPSLLMGVSVGLGKSTIACAEIGAYVRKMEANGKRAVVVYFVPRHDLAEELADRFARQTGIPAKIWRGTDAIDPDAPGFAMCREPALARAAFRAHVGLDTVCRLCPSKDICGYRRQSLQEAQVWFLPHQMLFLQKPSVIDEPSLIVIDESFWQTGLVGFDTPIHLVTSTFYALPPNLPEEDVEFVQQCRAKLITALANVGEDGFLTHQILSDANLTAEEAKDAHRAEWRAKPDFKVPRNPGDLVALLEHHATLFNSRVPRLWKLIAESLEGGLPRVVGVQLTRNMSLPGGRGFADALSLKWREDVANCWSHRPVLMLDATAQPELVTPYFPEVRGARRFEVAAPYQHVTQVVDRRFAKSMFVATSKKGGMRIHKPTKNVGRLRCLIECKALQYQNIAGAGDTILVITQKAVEAALRDGPLPPRVALRHFNDIAGADIYRDVSCVIVVGRTLPQVTDIEEQAEVLAGRPITRLAAKEWPGDAIEIRTSSGPTSTVQAPRHSDPIAEAVRWSIAEGNVIQAIGRGRGINRTATNPVEILLLTDLPVPLHIDKIVPWRQLRGNRVQRAYLLGKGVMPLSSGELARVYGPNGTDRPVLWKSVDAAKDELSAAGENGVKTLLGPLLEFSPHYWVTYRRHKQRGRPSPALVTSPDRDVAREQLERIVGPITAFHMLEPDG